MVIFRYMSPTDLPWEPAVVLHGAVVTQDWHHLWIGACVLTNNSAELPALGETFLWLLNESPDDGTALVHIRYDSQCEANIATGKWAPHLNTEVAERVRALAGQAGAKRRISWEHVYVHTGAHDNEVADRAVDRGRRGQVSDMSQRWAAPPPQLQGLDIRDTDFCRTCGLEVLARDTKWHVRRCTVEGCVIPEGKEKCRACGMILNGKRSQHGSKCRGSDLANRTCRKRRKYFPPPPRPLGNCEGGSGRRLAGRARAQGRAITKGKAKAKARAKPKP